MSAQSILDELSARIGADRIESGTRINPDDLHDESLHPRSATPLAVVRPRSTSEVAEIARIASLHRVPIVPRGSGTGLSGAVTPVADGLVVSFSEMNQVLHLNERDHVVVVQPGITLSQLDEVLSTTPLRYPVYPGEMSGSLGGNVNTNAGGMRAVRHGVTRQHVLGLELVLVDGTVLRTGGSFVKSSSGYDLTQLIVGSEGTLAMVTEVTLRLSPRFEHGATLLVPFETLEAVAAVVPLIISSGLNPSILEYLDLLTMSAVTTRAGLDLGVDARVAASTTAYLVIVLETRTRSQLEEDIEALATLLEGAGALDTYVLATGVAHRLIEGRERVFWASKEAGVNDILDIVVPRSVVPRFLADVGLIAQRHGCLAGGCGHVGDGNVHLFVLQPDDVKRQAFLDEMFEHGVQLGGAVSGEHGIGIDKQRPFLRLSDPTSLALQRGIKKLFDPKALLNPFRLLDDRVLP
ncbi:MAG: FAD-binding protein [Acidimicrobiaceae bacterium]|nr:FAD-binding protein [Acidimicrobiaceae bacterium]